MRNSICNLCGSKNLIKLEGKVRDNDELEILKCKDCGLVFLSSFEHIKPNFYEDAGMHKNSEDIDIEKWIAETKEDDERRFDQYKDLITDKIILDFGCGCGGFLKLAKNLTKHAYGIELEKRLKPYFEKENLNVFNDVSKISKKVDYLFMFHVLEHIENPIPLLETFKSILKPDGKLVIEVPNSDDALLTLYKNKAFSEFTYWSPHLYLYNEKTLEMLMYQADYKKVKIRQEQRYSLANHLYWLANGKPAGHKIWHFLDSNKLNLEYQKSLAKAKACDTIYGEFSYNDTKQ